MAKQYAFKETILQVNGVVIEGFTEGDSVVTVETLADSMTHQIGADGEMTASKQADESGSMTFSLSQSSDSNIFMSSLLSTQSLSNELTLSASFKDTNSGDQAIGSRGYIKTSSAMTRGTGINAQEWVMVFESLTLNHGGG